MKRTLFSQITRFPLALALVLFFSPLCISATDVAPVSGFATPQDAFSAFIDALKQNDFNAALSTFAYKEKAKGIDSKAYALMIAAEVGNSPWPKGFEAYNEALYYTQAIGTVKSALFCLLGLPELGKITIIHDEQAVNDYEAYLRPERLKDIRIEKFEDFNSTLSSDNDSVDRNNANMKKQATVYGAQEVVLYNATLSLGENAATAAPIGFIKYNGFWKLNSAFFNPRG
jgi:hypothetical protein